MERITCVLSGWQVLLLPTDPTVTGEARAGQGAPGRRRGPARRCGRRLSPLAPAVMCPWDLSHLVTIPQATKQAPDTIRGRALGQPEKGALAWVSSGRALSRLSPSRHHTHSLLLCPGEPGRTDSRSNPSSLLGTPSPLKRSVFLGKQVCEADPVTAHPGQWEGRPTEVAGQINNPAAPLRGRASECRHH